MKLSKTEPSLHPGVQLRAGHPGALVELGADTVLRNAASGIIPGAGGFVTSPIRKSAASSISLRSWPQGPL